MTEIEYLRLIAWVLSMDFVYTCYKDIRSHVRKMVNNK